MVSSSLRSMTGYGRGSGGDAHVQVEVELRSVNGRGLSLKVRLPSDRLALETKVDELLRKRLDRGTVQGQVRIQVLRHRPAIVDHEVLRRYLREWRAIEKDLGMELRDPELGELLRLPGAMETPPETQSTRRSVERNVKAALEEAVSHLVDSRAKEGSRLGRVLGQQLSSLRRNAAKASKRQPAAVREAQARLRRKVRSSDGASSADGPWLERELAAFAERADVEEELARLEIHCDRLEVALKQGGAIGRELEFLIQECHREVTTLGNKSGDAKISGFVVAMKLALQRMKEQVANVE